MMCVHCKKAVFFEEKDYAKVVAEGRTMFYHGKCFWEVYQPKGGESNLATLKIGTAELPLTFP